MSNKTPFPDMDALQKCLDLTRQAIEAWANLIIAHTENTSAPASPISTEQDASKNPMTKQEFAERIGISVRMLEKMIKQRKVRPVRIGRRIFFREHHVAELLDNCDTSKKKLLINKKLR